MSNKVKVRIAVAVDANGEWSAFGDSEVPEQSAMRCATGGTKTARYWLEAELDLPTEATVVEDVRVERESP